MKTYQKLTLIGVIYQIIILLFFITLITGLTYYCSVPEHVNYVCYTEFYEMSDHAIIISIIGSIIAIAIAFTMKNTKTIGYILLGLSFVMILFTYKLAIITWILFLVGGISAIKFKEEIVNGKQIAKKVDMSSLDILKERCAKGEITKEEFDKMKEDLN